MASIGDRLREAREKNKWSLEKVHKDIKIHPRILKAIEEDKGDELLSSTYIKGFIRKYAQYLKLDSREIVEEYKSLHPQPPPLILELDKGKEAKIGYRGLFRSFKVLLIIVVSVLFIGYLWFVVESIFKSQPQERSAEITKKVVKVSPPSPLRIVAKKKPLKLTIRALQDSWMQVKSDGIIVFENVLSKGKQEKWTAKKEIEIWVGNAEGLELVLNGKELGAPGKGVIKGILITRKGMTLK